MIEPTADAAPALFIKDIIIDCVELDRTVAFWSALLERPVSARIGPFVWLERVDGIGLGFQQVTDTGPGHKRLHLDLGSPDPAAQQQRVEALGGCRVPGYEDGGFLVLADPEGNEFCVIPAGPFDVDDEGRANYPQS